jgi:L-threonylcarbamoyladenylate synthase
VKTLRLVVNPNHLDSAEAREALTLAAELLRGGGTVALPTETVYGLGANALDELAVARIFAAKQRPAWDPVIVHVDSEAMLSGLVAGVPEKARSLIAAFWPGPLTLLLPRSAAVPDAVTAGRPLVGLRMPAHPVAFALIRRAGVPVAAPSANRFGHTSPTTAAHVLDDLDGRIDAVLDAGPAAHGLESTVLDPNQSPMVIYRPGAITMEQIRAVAGEAIIFTASGVTEATPREGLPSPGVGMRHYAPKARLVLVEAGLVEPGLAEVWLADLGRQVEIAVADARGEQVGVMLPAEADASAMPRAAVVHPWGRWSVPEDLARGLYAGLRQLDAQGCTVIVCPVPPAEGIGAAVRDRLTKAARSAGTT